MKDLSINPENLELQIEDGNFVLISTVSAQNGYMFLNTRRVNILRPTLGVGYTRNINDTIVNAKSTLNKWATQVTRDGALTAKWTGADINSPINITVQYNE